MPSNTVRAVIQRFLNNKHRKEFMEANPWMSLQVACVVFYRRHTSNKLAYRQYDNYVEYFQQERLRWWQIPVSKERCDHIRPATLEKYDRILLEYLS